MPLETGGNVQTQSLGTQPSGKAVTYDAFLRSQQDMSAEWVAGEVISLSPASNRHQAIVQLLTAVLMLMVEQRELGCVRVAPFNMRLPEKPSGREPDILFVEQSRCGMVQANFLDGAADLVVEVTSPESIARDRGEKFVEYETAGIREYWLIDPDREQVELYRIGKNGRFAIVSADPDGRLTSAVIAGFWLQPDWLWQEPLPKIVEIAQALGAL